MAAASRGCWLLLGVVLLQGFSHGEIQRGGAPSLQSGECEGKEKEYEQCKGMPACPSACRPQHCVFSEWGDWFSLGGCIGLCTRQRDLAQSNNECGRPCEGPKIETVRRDDCLPKSCHFQASDCHWGSWSQWTRNMGDELGQSYRVRRVQKEASGGGVPCVGHWNETRPFVQPSVQDCEWQQWSEWTPCTQTCGGGSRSHHRRIATHASAGGMPCEGPLRITMPCGTQSCGGPRTAVLSAWTEWDGCHGKYPMQRFRKRVITVPAMGGVQMTATPMVETEPCARREKKKRKTCNLWEWTAWGPCSATCGGQRSRHRDINFGISTADCHLPLGAGLLPLNQTEPCGPQHCTVEVQCHLSGWSEWGTCSKNCGIGTTERTRKIEREGAGGLGSGLALKEVKACEMNKCGEVDCKWAEWEDWSACSCTCDGGTKRRNRIVEDAPRNGGKLCDPVDKSEVAPCNTQSCASCRDGLWGVWGSWSKCSATCGGSFRVRHRDVEQRPNACGKPAIGLEDDFQICHTPSCDKDLDCRLDEWLEWSACSCECFGVKERHRRILNFASGKGKPCGAVAGGAPHGSSQRQVTLSMGAALEEVSPCNPGPHEHAPFHCGPLPKRPCNMSAWAEWGECSVSCGGGQRERARHILTPQAHGGKPCDGTLSEIAACGIGPCERKVCKDCEWGPWSEWGDCSKCGGQRYRQRAIVKMPDECGKPCDPGTGKEVDTCTSHCEKVGWCTWSQWSEMAGCSASCGTASKMRQRQLVLQSTKPEAQSEVVGIGKCQSGADLHYKSYNVVGADSPKDCRAVLLQVSDQPGVQGAQFAAGPRVCQLLVDEGKDLSTSSVSRSVELSTEANPDGDATGEIKHVDHAPGYMCYRLASGTFFQGDRNMPCSGSQIDLMECPLRSCHSCDPVDCVFGEWSQWGAPSCTQLCERHRVIKKMNDCGGAACDGALVETKHCAKDCTDPKDCEFTEWSDWDVTHCHGKSGQRTRDRRVAQPSVNGGKSCSGPTEETVPCVSEKTVPVDCEVGEWEMWNKCTATCGTGERTRSRKITIEAEHGGKPCLDALETLAPCNAGPCGDKMSKNCVLGEWGEWGDATNEGLCYRHRSILIQAVGDGSPCGGALNDAKPCDGATDCIITEWSRWDSCDATCGGGQQNRGRHVTRNPRNGGTACPEHLEETRGCNTQPCSVTSCEVNDWSSWGKCSASCGPGMQLRSRYVTQMPKNGGAGCNMPLAEARSCNAVGSQAECHGPTDCLWSHWSDWSGCTCDCNGGQRTRERRIEQIPTPGGRPCDALHKEEIEPCNTQPCHTGGCIDALWEEWSKWEACTKTCKGGITWRSRKVRRQANECGKPPTGMSMEHASCNNDVPCHPDVDCMLGEWELWSGCTLPCSGIKRRARTIKVHGARNGKWCEGDLKQTSPCPDHESCNGGVPLDCETSPWHVWGVCSATCGIGQKIRSRNLLHNPENGGHPCDKALVQTAGCKEKPCQECTPVDCRWGDWEMWSACDKCGGQRKRYRHIQVQPDCGGAPCAAHNAEEMGNCTRRCHERTYCAWQEWQPWNECSNSCGDLGKRSRVRFLKAFTAPPNTMVGHAGLNMLEAKFADLKTHAQSTQSQRYTELGTAFFLGSFSFAGMLFMGQRWSRGFASPGSFLGAPQQRDHRTGGHRHHLATEAEEEHSLLS